MLNIYGLDDHIIEIYEQTQRQLEDVELLKKLLGDGGPKRVLEPFCGTGRVFMGLAACGHEIFGIDSSASMLSAGRRKLDAAPEGLRRRITLARKDVMSEEWPRGFDAVLLANNSLYELPSPELQLDCLRRAAKSLSPGGKLFLDNYCVQESLSPSMYAGRTYDNVFPTGTCADGSRVRGSMETLEIDHQNRRILNRHRVVVDWPDGTTDRYSWDQERHLPNIGEVRMWLDETGFRVEHLWGDRDGTPYTSGSPRVVIWAAIIGNRLER